MDARLYVDDDDAGLRAAQHLNATAVALAKARAAVINQAGNAKALLDAVPEAARQEPGYMFSRIQVLRRENKIKEAAQLLLAAPRDPAKDRQSGSVVGRAAADCAQAARSRRAQDWPMTSPTARRLRTATISAPSSISPPAGSPCASCASQASPWRISPASPTAPRTRSRSPARITGRRAPRRPWDAIRMHGRCSRRRRTIRPPITASWRARRLGLDEVTLRELPDPSADHRMLELARVFEILYAIDNRDLIASMAADLGDKATDLGALVTLADVYCAPQRRARDAPDRQAGARPRLSDGALCVSRISACRTISRSDRRSSAAWSIRSCDRKAPSIRAWFRAPTRSA